MVWFVIGTYISILSVYTSFVTMSFNISMLAEGKEKGSIKIRK